LADDDVLGATLASALLDVLADRCATPALDEEPPQPASTSAALAHTTTLNIILVMSGLLRLQVWVFAVVSVGTAFVMPRARRIGGTRHHVQRRLRIG
jgi:hypothetical protein